MNPIKQASGGLFFGGRTNAIAFQHNIRCAKQIQKEILQAEEGEVLDNEVEDFVVRDLDSLNCAFTALSSACPGLKTFTTVLTYCNDAPAFLRWIMLSPGPKNDTERRNAPLPITATHSCRMRLWASFLPLTAKTSRDGSRTWLMGMIYPDHRDQAASIQNATTIRGHDSLNRTTINMPQPMP